MKKIIISITIISFLNLIGCFYQEQMNPGDYTFDENSTMKITTKDTVYNFSGDEYHLVNDTLIAELSTKLDKKTTLKTDVEIPVKDIEKLEVERSDVLLTTLTVLGVSIGALGLLVLIAGSSGGGGGKCGPSGGPEKHGI